MAVSKKNDQVQTKEAGASVPGAQTPPQQHVNGSNVALTALTAGNLPAEFRDEMAQDAGKGVSTLASDNIIPMIYVLQTQSPQVNERNPDTFIAGAKPGFFWLRNSPVPIVSGEQGFAFQPCHFTRAAIEWVPRDLGGGFVARHDFLSPGETMDELAKRLKFEVEASDKRNRPPTYRNGDNEIKEMRYHTGYVHGGLLGLQDAPGLVLPFVIPFGGTGHGVSRGWMTSMNQHTFPGDSQKVLPSFTRLYKLTTKWRKNAAGEWAQVFVEDTVGWVPGFPNDLSLYRRGKSLFESMERGETKIETTGLDETAGADGGETVSDAAKRAGV